MLNKDNSTAIYIIKNIINNRLYVGQTRLIKKRKSQHFNHLNRGTHFNSHLQNAFNKYGKTNFIFQILEYTTIDKLNEREQYYIDFYGIKNLYNIAPIAGTFCKTPETINKTKKTLLLRYNGNPNRKRVYKIEFKTNAIIQEYMSIKDAAIDISPKASQLKIKDIGAKISSVCRGKRGKAWGFKWRYVDILYPDFIYKEQEISVKQIDLITGEVIATFKSIQSAAKRISIEAQTISDVCQGINKTAGGFKWECVNDEHKKKQTSNITSIMKPVYQIDKNTNEIIARFNSSKEAARILCIGDSHISSVCSGKRLTTGGFKWRYV